MLCKDYRIKFARKHILSSSLLIPRWDEEDVHYGNESVEDVWRQAWKMLNWKFRSEVHFEAYWYLLHNRASRFRSGYEPENEQHIPTARWHTLPCGICFRRDTLKHRYWGCPEVNKIWQVCGSLLVKITGRPNILQAITWTGKEVLLCFPGTRRYLPKRIRTRVILWHSLVIFLVWKRRRLAIKEIQNDNAAGFINFLDPP